MVISIAIGVLFWLFTESAKSEVNRLEHKIGSMDIESKLSTSFSDTSSKGIENLSKIIASRVREHFGIKARSHFELLKHIRDSSRIPEETKMILEEYFTEMTHIAYKQEELTGPDRDMLQEKARLILQKLH